MAIEKIICYKLLRIFILLILQIIYIYISIPSVGSVVFRFRITKIQKLFPPRGLLMKIEVLQTLNIEVVVL